MCHGRQEDVGAGDDPGETTMVRDNMKDCFGEQGRDALFGESCEKCIRCSVFEKCHKISIAICLQAISSDTNLITQNGLTRGWLFGYQKLDQLNETEEADCEQVDGEGLDSAGSSASPSS
jgi:hypothetical protein